MSWSPADDYDDNGNYVNPLRPLYRGRRWQECQPGYWPDLSPMDPEGFMLDPDNHH